MGVEILETDKKQNENIPIQTATELCDLWLKRAIVAQRAHYATAARRELQNRIIGTLAIIFNVLVSSAIFSMLTSSSQQTELKFICGVASIFAALLSGLQTSRRDGERAEEHRNIAAKFSCMQRDLELIQIKKLEEKEFISELRSFDEHYKNLLQDAPTADSKLFKRYHKHIFMENSKYSILTESVMK